MLCVMLATVLCLVQVDQCLHNCCSHSAQVSIPSSTMQQGAVLETVWAAPPGSPYSFPCVDCGLLTGNFCDGGVTTAYDTCFACDRVPLDYPKSTQRTPLCPYCETLSGVCRFCRKVHGCTPKTRQNHWSGLPLDCSRSFDRSRHDHIVAAQFAQRQLSNHYRQCQVQ